MNISTSDILTLAIVAVLIFAVWKYQTRVRGKATSGGYSGHLEEVTENVTQKAREKLLDPVTGREDELDRVVHILMRRTKNNPLLVGEAGVGKTAIVEGLAQKIAAREIPEPLRNKEILSLDINALVSETKYRGELEQRLRRLIVELESSAENTILFIDEIHLIAQLGGVEGSLNISDVLKPALARGDLQVIGATTWDEYQEFIVSDTALARRLQPVLVDEPTKEVTLQILNNLRGIYEDFHHVKIDDEALEAAVELADEKIDYRYLPDSAIDLIDEASAKVSIEAHEKHRTAIGVVHAAAKVQTDKVTRQDVEEVVEQWITHSKEDKKRDARS